MTVLQGGISILQIRHASFTLGRTTKAPAKRSQHVATLLGATCCVRLATVLRHVGCCWLKFEAGQI